MGMHHRAGTQTKINVSKEGVNQAKLDVAKKEAITDMEAETMVTKADGYIKIDSEGVNQAALDAALKVVIANLQVMTIDALSAKDINPALAEITLESLEFLTKKEAAEILKNAHLVNIFIEHEGAPPA
jgi:hypothetical protein